LKREKQEDETRENLLKLYSVELIESAEIGTA
jgi:hypothetical protein